MAPFLLHHVACLADGGHRDGAGRAAFGPACEKVLLHVGHGFPVVVDGALAVGELFLALVQLLGQLQVALLFPGKVVLQLAHVVLQVRQVQVLVQRVDLGRVLLGCSQLLLARLVPLKEAGLGRVGHLACCVSHHVLFYAVKYGVFDAGPEGIHLVDLAGFGSGVLRHKIRGFCDLCARW